MHQLSSVQNLIQPQRKLLSVFDHLPSGLANVVLAGHVDPFEYLLGCDVFVFPTWMEGSAKAVYEALAVGLPVVTTPCAGSVVEDGKDGFIVPPGDVESIREKLLCFKKDRKMLSDMAEKAKCTG